MVSWRTHFCGRVDTRLTLWRLCQFLRENPEVVKYLEAEKLHSGGDRRAQTVRRHPLPGNARPHQADRLSVPVRRGSYWYYSRTEEGKQYPIRAVRKRAADGTVDAGI